MKILDIHNKPTFKGYKNLISVDCAANKDEKFSLIAVQLDNEGSSDLNNYKKLASYSKCFNKKDIDDVFVCSYLKFPDFDAVCLNNDALLSGKALNNTKNLYTPQEFLHIETGELKAYTQIANLTKKIMNGDIVTKHDVEVHKILAKLQKILIDFYDGDTRSVFEILRVATHNKNPRRTAAIINAGVTKALKNYF